MIEVDHLQLPRMLDIKARVDGGETANEFDITFLQETLNEVRPFEYFAESHPQYKKLIAEVASLFKHITQKATENESNSQL